MSESGSVGGRAASSIPWIALDKWGTRLISIVVLLVLGRILSVDDFGLIALAQIFIAFAGVFVDQGFSKALIQRFDLTPTHVNTAFFASNVLAVILAGASALLSGPISSLFGSPDLQPVIAVLSGALVVNALSSTPAALMERDFRFRELAIRRVSGAFAGGVAGIVLALAGAGVWSLVAQTMVAAVVGLISIWLTSGWRPGTTVSRDALRELWSVGFAVLGIELIGLVNSQSDRLLVAAFLSTEALGFYFMAMRLVSLLVELFSSIFSTVSLTSLSRLQNDRPSMLRLLYKLAGSSCAVAIPVFTGAVIMAPVLFEVVIGAKWQPSVVLFQILCGLGALNALAYFDRSTLLAVGRAGAAFQLTLGQSILGILLVLGVAPFGVIWVALAVTARQYLFWPIRLWYLARYAGVRPLTYFVQWFTPFLISVFVLLGAFLLSSYVVRFDDSPLAYTLVMIPWWLGSFALGFRLFMWDTVRTAIEVVRRRGK
ncbi:lipopolysaccharide biosynthesis protein [Microbacterium sp. NPDC089190]|uniref:lipopolysaccharide biosynthesis protein n=1 Tax=Microbacterium sp. NPDC089190 TaxID=3155063 RepID=UPI00344D9C07